MCRVHRLSNAPTSIVTMFTMFTIPRHNTPMPWRSPINLFPSFSLSHLLSHYVTNSLCSSSLFNTTGTTLYATSQTIFLWIEIFLRLCSFEEMNLKESVKMNLCWFVWMNMCVFLSEFRGLSEWIWRWILWKLTSDLSNVKDKIKIYNR